MDAPVPTLMQDALALYRAGRLEEAQALYERVLRDEPHNYNALNFLGLIHHRGGRHDAAAEVLVRAIALAPNVFGFHVNLGNARFAQQRYAEAEQCFRRALSLKPDDVGAMNNLGATLMRRGQLDEAIPYFRWAIERRPDHASAHNNLGNALRGKRMFREAVACYREAAALRADGFEAWANAAVAHLELGEFAEAEASSRRALALRPDHVESHYTLGFALEATGRTDEAVAQYRAAVKLRPENRGLRFHLAALSGEELFDAPPPGYVAGVFDGYAETFEKHLVQRLRYRGPELLRDALAGAGITGPFESVVDLGCGTGLCGALFRASARKLIGVDLSSRMIRQASERAGIYDELHVAEVSRFLRERPAHFDLALAADVLIYFGDLRELFAAVAGALRAGGVFAFTIEKHDGPEPFNLRRTRRFAQSIEYVRSMLAANALSELSAAEAPVRSENGEDVAGWVVVARKAR